MSKCQEQSEKGMVGGQALKQAEQSNTKEQKVQDHAVVCLLCPPSGLSLGSQLCAHMAMALFVMMCVRAHVQPLWMLRGRGLYVSHANC